MPAPAHSFILGHETMEFLTADWLGTPLWFWLSFAGIVLALIGASFRVAGPVAVAAKRLFLAGRKTTPVVTSPFLVMASAWLKLSSPAMKARVPSIGSRMNWASVLRRALSSGVSSDSQP